MNKFRYVDNDILCKYDLSEEFFNKLSFEVEDIVPLRKVFVLLTTEGKKILKLTDSSDKRIDFINKALNYVSKKYGDILSYYEDQEGRVTHKSGENTYVILNMIEGREATFTNPVEIEICSKAIANMHLASRGIFNILDADTVKGNLGEYLPYQFNRAKEDLINIKEYILRFRHKVEFDVLVLDNIDKHINEIQKSIDLIAMCNYNSLLENFNKRVLCHNDLAHHNFIIDGDEVKIIDFDYCKIDARAVDIANFAMKVIKNTYYDMDTFKLILESYNSIDILSKDEIKLIYGILSFPKDFTTITRDYYYKQKKWEYEVFLNRLKEKINNEIHREEFIKKFITELSQYFY
ncbi:CotS family spore coat protein [Clostridium sp. AL.422]|uniref:CotS family spore coat protein n=1 Tax=Clostridium TaxID=1485 RepID=UPI00293DABAE|nr:MULTISPECIES: CotS family spore coat protein [unclassified Clostridium]MDV4149512.1 CotS family spore coat protein [Clostridium sp. AL.422]